MHHLSSERFIGNASVRDMRANSFTHKRVKGLSGVKSSTSARTEEELLARVRGVEKDDLFLRRLGGWAQTTVYSRSIASIRGIRKHSIAIAVTRKALYIIAAADVSNASLASLRPTVSTQEVSRRDGRRGGQASFVDHNNNELPEFATAEMLTAEQGSLGSWSIQCRVPLSAIAGIVFTEADPYSVAIDFTCKPTPWNYSVLTFTEPAQCDDFVGFLLREKLKLMGKRASASAFPANPAPSPSMSTYMSSLRHRATSAPPVTTSVLSPHLPNFISTINEPLLNVEYGKRVLSLVKLRRKVDDMSTKIHGRTMVETEDDYEGLAANPDIVDLIRSRGDTTLNLSARVDFVKDRREAGKPRNLCLILVTDSSVIILQQSEREYKLDQVFRIETINYIAHSPAQNLLLFKVFRDTPSELVLGRHAKQPHNSASPQVAASPSAASPLGHHLYDAALGGSAGGSGVGGGRVRLKEREILIHTVALCPEVGSVSHPSLGDITAEEVTAKILQHVEKVFLDVRIRRLPVKVERDVQTRTRLDMAVAAGSKIVAKFIAKATQSHPHQPLSIRDCFSVAIDNTIAYKWLLVIVRIRMFDLIDTFANLNMEYAGGATSSGSVTRTRAELHAEMMVERRLVLSLLALCAHLDLTHQLLYESVLYELMSCVGRGPTAMSLLFQRDTFPMRVILLYLGNRADQYVKLVLSQSMDDFLKLKQHRSVEAHAAQFLEVFHRESNLDVLPHELKVVIAIITRCVADITRAGLVPPDLNYRRCIGAFLTQRLWGPALQTPDACGLTSLQLTPRQIAFLAKIVNLLNSAMGLGDLDPELGDVSTWMKECNWLIHEYVHSLIDADTLNEIVLTAQDEQSSDHHHPHHHHHGDDASISETIATSQSPKSPAGLHIRRDSSSSKTYHASFSAGVSEPQSGSLLAQPSPPRGRTPPILSFLQGNVRRNSNAQSSLSPLDMSDSYAGYDAVGGTEELRRRQSLLRGGTGAVGDERNFRSSFHQQSATRHKVMEVSDEDVLALANNLESVHEALGRDTERLLVSLITGIKLVERKISEIEKKLVEKRTARQQRHSPSWSYRKSSGTSDDSFREEAPREAKRTWNRALAGVSMIVSMNASTSVGPGVSRHVSGEFASSTKTAPQTPEQSPLSRESNYLKAKMVVDRIYLLPAAAALIAVSAAVVVDMTESIIRQYDPARMAELDQEIKRVEAILTSRHHAVQALREGNAALQLELESLEDHPDATSLLSAGSPRLFPSGTFRSSACSGSVGDTVLSQTRVLGQDTVDWPVSYEGMLTNQRRWCAFSHGSDESSSGVGLAGFGHPTHSQRGAEEEEGGDGTPPLGPAAPSDGEVIYNRELRFSPEACPAAAVAPPVSKYQVKVVSGGAQGRQQRGGDVQAMEEQLRSARSRLVRGVPDGEEEDDDEGSSYGGDPEGVYCYSSSEVDDDELRYLLEVGRGELEPLSRHRRSRRGGGGSVGTTPVTLPAASPEASPAAVPQSLPGEEGDPVEPCGASPCKYIVQNLDTHPSYIDPSLSPLGSESYGEEDESLFMPD